MARKKPVPGSSSDSNSTLSDTLRAFVFDDKKSSDLAWNARHSWIEEPESCFGFETTTKRR